jgi:hypothetical protein
MQWAIPANKGTAGNKESAKNRLARLQQLPKKEAAVTKDTKNIDSLTATAAEGHA